MLSIPEIQNLSDGMTVDSVQVTVHEVYERRNHDGQNGPTTVQNAVLVDDKGNKIKASAWGHSDLTPLKGQTVILHSTKGNRGLAGVKVRHTTYKATKDFGRYKVGDTVPSVELSVSKTGCFQHVAVYQQQSGQPMNTVPPAQQSVKPEQPVRASTTDAKAEGQREGMCFKLAGDFVIASMSVDSRQVTEQEFADRVKYACKLLLSASRSL